jgi:hypothetical protein
MHHLLVPVLAVGWDLFLQILPFVIAVLVWVINRFATAAAQKQPPGKAAMRRPVAPPAGKPAGDPLQNEIDEFLRQAKAAREGQGTAPQPMRPAVQGEQRGAPPQSRPGQPPIARPQRRLQPPPGKRVARRDETRQPPAVRPPVIVEVVEAAPVRESVAEHVAQAMDSEKFSRRATELSHVQKSTDDEFQQHMQRVFQHGLGSLKSEPAGIFEAAAATAAATASAATVKADAAAGGKQTGTAPVATQKGASDIALFLAGRKNIRDAVILSEIIRRPEW